MHIVVWIVEGTWQGCVDAAVQNFPADSRFTVLHVTPSDVTEAADAASIGLFGRGFPGRKPNRLGHSDVEIVSLRGRVEREVARVVAGGVDVLVVARDGDRSRLGPRSLGHATRFIVDHAPCAVMLVWPDETPGIDSIPPPKHGPKPPHPPHPHHEDR